MRLDEIIYHTLDNPTLHYKTYNNNISDLKQIINLFCVQRF